MEKTVKVEAQVEVRDLFNLHLLILVMVGTEL
jgi:hypothetical protein